LALTTAGSGVRIPLMAMMEEMRGLQFPTQIQDEYIDPDIAS